MSESEQEKLCRRVAFIEDRIKAEFGWGLSFAPGTFSARMTDMTLACIMEDEAFRAAKDDVPDGGSPRIILNKEDSGTLRIVYHNDGTVMREFTGGSEEFTFTEEDVPSTYTAENVTIHGGKSVSDYFREASSESLGAQMAKSALAAREDALKHFGLHSPQQPISYNHVSVNASTTPCPDCAHTEHPGRYVGIDTDEACRTCSGSAVV